MLQDRDRPLCWLRGTSVRNIHAFLRTDVSRSQHSSFRLIPTPIKLTEVSELRTVLAPWALRWRMMREQDEQKALYWLLGTSVQKRHFEKR
jgi:hypothetical protein